MALIQSAFAAIGILVVGIPGAGDWSVVFLVCALLQVGVIVLIPAVIRSHVLKPILLGRRAVVPIVVVFLGAIGGFVALALIGLFVGAVVLSVGYKLFLAWIEGGAEQPMLAQVLCRSWLS